MVAVANTGPLCGKREAYDRPASQVAAEGERTAAPPEAVCAPRALGAAAALPQAYHGRCPDLGSEAHLAVAT
eukprot:714651-Pyramimonas_sp.AAC.1